MKRLRVILLVAVLMTGCADVALHHNLNESEADKILVLLDNNGIHANKEKAVEGQEVSWTIMVPKTDLFEARRLLVENNLPSRPELGLSGVYSEKGLIPTPDEQRARFLLALKGEVVNALRKIPGVHEVGVVLNVPEEKELQLEGEEEARPSASVVIRVGDPSVLHQELTEEKIKRFVANAIPEMEASQVVVIISSADRGPALAGTVPKSFSSPPREPGPPEPGGIAFSPGVSERVEGALVDVAGIELDADSVNKFKLYLVVFLLVLILLSAALLLTLFRFSRMRRSARPQRLQALPLEGKTGGRPDLLTSGQEAIGPRPGPGETGTGA